MFCFWRELYEFALFSLLSFYWHLLAALAFQGPRHAHPVATELCLEQFSLLYFFYFLILSYFIRGCGSFFACKLQRPTRGGYV